MTQQTGLGSSFLKIFWTFPKEMTTSKPQRQVAELRKEQKRGTSPRSLADYVGTYWDPIHIFQIEVTLEEQTLHWSFQDLESEKFRLDHYELDIFTWLRPSNELAARGRWVDQGVPFWKVDFKASANGHIGSLM